jgi:glutamyl-Q tRNA(Asp) synthetase
LHFGSLLAAVASYLEARTRNGIWLLRIEDIDPPRELAGASREILTALEHYGFEWDGPVSYQSASRAEHEAALARLSDAGHLYPCGCSRRDVEDEPAGPLGPIYPGTCRSGTRARDTALRARTTDEPLVFEDRLQGRQFQRLESDSGDFVVQRRDGLIAYQLAVVVDDYLQGASEVVRGVDLLPSTARQIWLQRLLGYPTPGYAHIPVAVDAAGQKLSKSTGAAPLPLRGEAAVLVAALAALGQAPPKTLQAAALRDVWLWARANWRLDVLKGRSQIPLAETEKGVW